MRAACRAFRVYFTKPTPEEIKRGDYLLDHSIISYLVDPEGEFADYYGKSLSADEMYGRVAKLIGEWERQKWWDSVLPAALASLWLWPTVALARRQGDWQPRRRRRLRRLRCSQCSRNAVLQGTCARC